MHVEKESETATLGARYRFYRLAEFFMPRAPCASTRRSRRSRFLPCTSSTFLLSPPRDENEKYSRAAAVFFSTRALKLYAGAISAVFTLSLFCLWSPEREVNLVCDCLASVSTRVEKFEFYDRGV